MSMGLGKGQGRNKAGREHRRGKRGCVGFSLTRRRLPRLALDFLSWASLQRTLATQNNHDSGQAELEQLATIEKWNKMRDGVSVETVCCEIRERPQKESLGILLKRIGFLTIRLNRSNFNFYYRNAIPNFDSPRFCPNQTSLTHWAFGGWKMAERGGFEPPIPFRVFTLSRRAP